MPPKPMPRWKVPGEGKEPTRPAESKGPSLATTEPSPTAVGGRLLVAFLAVGLSIFVNGRSSTVPVERMSAPSLIGMVIGFGLLGAFAYWLAGKIHPVLAGGGFCLLAMIVTGLDSGSTSAARLTTASTPAVHPEEEPRVIPLRKLSPQEWQACLVASGYDLGPAGVDGIWGQKSQEAYTAFWAAHPSGTVNEIEIRRCWGGSAENAPITTRKIISAPVKPRKSLDEAIKNEVVHESGPVEDVPVKLAPAVEPAPVTWGEPPEPAVGAPVTWGSSPTGVAPLPDYGSRTEHVSGYTRKDGTYVAPYTRRPSR